MKIRNGFVSNSSSSSFIILLNKNIISPKDMKNVASFIPFCFEVYDNVNELDKDIGDGEGYFIRRVNDLARDVNLDDMFCAYIDIDYDSVDDVEARLKRMKEQKKIFDYYCLD